MHKGKETEMKNPSAQDLGVSSFGLIIVLLVALEKKGILTKEQISVLMNEAAHELEELAVTSKMHEYINGIEHLRILAKLYADVPRN